MKCAIAANNSLVGIDDADLGVAFNVTAQSAGFSTGQRCMASSRMIVTECICDKFVAAVIDKIKMLKIDTALTAGTDIGPVASVNRAQGTNARELYTTVKTAYTFARYPLAHAPIGARQPALTNTADCRIFATGGCYGNRTDCTTRSAPTGQRLCLAQTGG